MLSIKFVPNHTRDYQEQTNGSTVFQQIIQYNNRGFIHQSFYDLNGTTNTENYTYKDNSWLNTYTRSQDSLSMSYDYDSFGLMSLVTRNGVTENHIQNPTNWQINGVTYDLDDLGRVKKRNTKDFLYGPNLRIKEVIEASTSLATYFYDEENNPISKQLASSNQEVYWQDMVYADNYLYMPLKLGSRVIGYFKNNQFIKASQNRLNTNLVDSTNNYQLSTPFGEKLRNQSPSQTEVNKILDFTLKGYDHEIEAVRMGRRYYGPKAKRFLTRDAYFIEKPEKIVGSPFEGNLFGYAGNNPLSFVDPSGEFTDPIENATLRSHSNGLFRPKNNTFGNVRNNGSKHHSGVDISASVGTPIKAVGNGKIIYSGNISGYGKSMILKFKYNYKTVDKVKDFAMGLLRGDLSKFNKKLAVQGKTMYALYSHLGKAEQVKNVNEGDVIGSTGKSGNAIGLNKGEDHLHFSLSKNPTFKPINSQYDPADYMNNLNLNPSEKEGVSK